MNQFAHNGVDHHSVAEAAAHSANDVIPTVLLVTAAVLVFIALAVWAARRFGSQTVANKDEEN